MITSIYCIGCLRNINNFLVSETMQTHLTQLTLQSSHRSFCHVNFTQWLTGVLEVRWFPTTTDY